MQNQNNDLSQKNLFHKRIKTGAKSAFRITYDTSLLLEREKQNLHRMQTAKDLLDYINVHARIQEDYFHHNIVMYSRQVLLNALHLETESRKQSMNELNEQICQRTHICTGTTTQIKELIGRIRADKIPIYSGFISQPVRNRKTHTRAARNSLIVQGNSISYQSPLLE